MVDDFQNILSTEAYRQFAERQYRLVDAVPTPLPALNSFCRGDGGGVGLAYGWHCVIAGATNMGKSNLAVNFACEAIRNGHSVVFVSLEMARHQIKQRVYSILSGEDSDLFGRGHFNEHSETAIDRMDEKLFDTTLGGPAQLFVNDKPVRNIYSIADTLEFYRENHGVRIFFVDYLQLCETGSEEDRRRQVSAISGQMMTYAHQVEVLSICLSQFNRFTTKDKKVSPDVEGMTESSSLENDADLALLLDHSKYEQDTLRPWIHRTWVKVGKNRHGRKGMIPIEWNWKNYTVREAEPDEEHLWPGAKK